ncbi:hypothetical protein SAMN04487792_1536 [Lactobacillus bombicola]|uniref:Uncharacterized protein n=1 Tax=Lactobacillus bombicola TaxID=1505723 RepID=A0A1I1TP89_9LACO|nr:MULTISPECIES: hypothetical protein [Lactobacillus]RMC46531.1 hypothetical protein F5ESL0230_04550 [Lactobacillus sp. ESL0230]SFD60357.1 hypothetical protein SAMN04487792_1536 [Lactobacillus bombicola]
MMKIITKDNSKIKQGSIIRTNRLIGKRAEYLMIADNLDGTYALVDLVRGVIKQCKFTSSELTEYLWEYPFNRIYSSDEIKLILGGKND